MRATDGEKRGLASLLNRRRKSVKIGRPRGEYHQPRRPTFRCSCRHSPATIESQPFAPFPRASAGALPAPPARGANVEALHRRPDSTGRRQWRAGRVFSIAVASPSEIGRPRGEYHQPRRPTFRCSCRHSPATIESQPFAPFPRASAGALPAPPARGANVEALHRRPDSTGRRQSRGQDTVLRAAKTRSCCQELTDRRYDRCRRAAQLGSGKMKRDPVAT